MSLNNRGFLEEALLSDEERQAAADTAQAISKPDSLNKMLAEMEEGHADEHKDDTTKTPEQINAVQLALGTGWRITNSVAQGLLFFGTANERVVIGVSVAAVPFLDFINHRVLHHLTHHSSYEGFPDVKEALTATFTAAGIGGAAQIASAIVSHSSWLPQETPEVAGAIVVGGASFLTSCAIISALRKRVFPEPHNVEDHKPATNKQQVLKLGAKYLNALALTEMVWLATGSVTPMIPVVAEVLRKMVSNLLFVPHPFEHVRERDQWDELELYNIENTDDPAERELVAAGLLQDKRSRLDKLKDAAEEACRYTALTAKGIVKKTRAIYIMASLGICYGTTAIACHFGDAPGICKLDDEVTLPQRAATAAGMMAFYLGTEKFLRTAVGFYNHRRTQKEQAAKAEQAKVDEHLPALDGKHDASQSAKAAGPKA